MPNVGGTIHAIVPDGNGGTFIGGSFSNFVNPDGRYFQRECAVAHILPNGSVDESWNPNILLEVEGFSDIGMIFGMTVSNGRLYIAGRFTKVNGQARYQLAALDIVTGAVHSWNANNGQTLVGYPSIQNLAYNMRVVANNNTIFGAGTMFLPDERGYVGGFEKTTGILTSWGSKVTSPLAPYIPRITALSVSNGVLYVAGQFLQIAGADRQNLAAFDANTGAMLPWNPGATTQWTDFLGAVTALSAYNGHIYYSGYFSGINGQARSGLGAVDENGSVTAWNPAPAILGYQQPYQSIPTIVANATAVYIGGNFTHIGGGAKAGIAAVDHMSGNLSLSTPELVNGSGLLAYTTAISATEQGLIFGGAFLTVDGLPKYGLSGVAYPPAQPASNLAVASQLPNGTGVTLTWDAPSTGAAGYTIVAIEGTSPATGLPQNGETYTGVPAFTGSATVPFSGQVVFDGSGTNFSITGLIPNTNYTFVVYPYNGSGIARVYGTGTPLTATFRTNSPPPPVVVRHPGILTVSSATLSFGDVALGGSRTRTYTMHCYNLTTASVRIVPPAQCAISVGGAAFTTSEFVFATRATIDSVQIRVRFSPTGNGAFSGIIQHVAGSTQATATLTGQSSPPSISTSTLSLNFGSVVPSSAATLAYRVNYRNLTTRSITLTPSAGYAVSTTGTEPFSAAPFTVPTAQSGRFNVFVKFSPVAVGVLGGSVKTTSPGVAGSPPNDPIGDGPSVITSGEGEYPLPGISATRLNFGDVPVGTCRTLSYTVFPAGGIRDQVTIICPQNAFSNVEVSTNGPDGPFTSGCQAVTFSRVAGVNSARVWVRFCPTTLGETLDFAINHLSQPGGQFVNLPLSGRSVGPEITVTPAAFNFGTVPVNQSDVTTLTVRIRNAVPPSVITLSTSAVNTAFAFLSNSTGTWSGTWTTTATATNATYRVNARFLPTAQQSYRTTFVGEVLAQNGSSTDTFTLSGRGVGPTLTVTAGTLNFNGNFLLTPNTRSYVLRYDNITTNTVEIGPTNHPAFLLSDAQNGVFSTSAGITFTVGGTATNPVSGNVTAWVRFLALEAGVTKATLLHNSFVSVGVTGANVELLRLSGVGLAPMLMVTTATNQNSLRFNDVDFGGARYYEYNLSYRNITGGTLRISIPAGSSFAVTSATGTATGATATWIGAGQAFTLIPSVLNTTATTNIKLWVRFTAAQAGVVRSTLAHVSLTDDPRTNAQDDFLCLGETLPAPILTLPSALLNLGGVIVGKSTTQVISLSNLDTLRPLTIVIPTNFAVSFTGEQGTFLTGTQTFSLTASAAATLTVRFTPTTAGVLTPPRMLRINNGSALPANIALTGEGIAPAPTRVRFVNERMYVRDEPFFPLGWSQIGTRDNFGIVGDAKNTARMKGVNFIENEGFGGAIAVAAGERHSVYKGDGRDLNNVDTIVHYYRRYLDTCQKGGVKTILNLYEYYPIPSFKNVLAQSVLGEEKRFEQLLSDDDVKKIMGDSYIRSHPALLGWWITSEPSGKIDHLYNRIYGPATDTTDDLGFKKPSTRDSVNREISKFYPLQSGLNRTFQIAIGAQGDNGQHFVGTMFQAGSIQEMTAMQELFANPSQRFFNFVLAEYYNNYDTQDHVPGSLHKFFERRQVLADPVHIHAGENLFWRNFSTAAPTTGLLQDNLHMNRYFRDYYAQMNANASDGGGIIIKLFGHRFEEGDGNQRVRPATNTELMFTTFTKIHATQNYLRPLMIGGIDLFGYDFFSFETAKNSNVFIPTAAKLAERTIQEKFIEFFAKYNLGIVFQAPKVNDFQGNAFARVQVGAGASVMEREAEGAIKTVVRYHNGSYYLAVINNRLNEQLPAIETDPSTGSYGSAGGNQRFIATDSIRIILPPRMVLENCVELSATVSGNETTRNLVAEQIAGLGSKQVLRLDSLGAAEVRLFRFHTVHPQVDSVTSLVLAVQTQKDASSQHSVSQESINHSLAPTETANDLFGADSEFQIFPNPAIESATLHFPAVSETERLTLTITDMYGNIVVRTEIRERDMAIPTRLLPSGAYICLVQSKQRTWNRLLHVVK
ncbi:MAG: hypothetical protein EAZ92_17795 [Candidatus Kapaibacterium sp.]|nr:MAG: hypothetical protein EAZ92_17795 [Candidatus Kapabacteria bacterium]